MYIHTRQHFPCIPIDFIVIPFFTILLRKTVFLGPNKNESSACGSDRTQLKIYRCQLFCEYFMSALLLYLLSLRILIILCIHAAVSFALAYLLILLLKILFYLGTERGLFMSLPRSSSSRN